MIRPTYDPYATKKCPVCIGVGKWYKSTGTLCATDLTPEQQINTPLMTCPICMGRKSVPIEFGNLDENE